MIHLLAPGEGYTRGERLLAAAVGTFNVCEGLSAKFRPQCRQTYEGSQTTARMRIEQHAQPEKRTEQSMIRRLAQGSALSQNAIALQLTHGQPIVPGIPHRVHRMGGNFVYTVKDEVVLHDHEPESISPVPGVVLDHPVSVHFNPEVEHDE